MKNLFAAILLFATTGAFAEIREIHSMAEALRAVQPGDLVVLDIDNTIYQPLQTLGSDQWFVSHSEKYKAAGLSEDQAIDQSITDDGLVQQITKVRAVQNINPLYIRRAQRTAMRVMALTARPLAWKDITVGQLKSVHVNLRNDGVEYGDGKDIEYYKGVLFVGPKNNKGLVLKKFLDEAKLRVKRIVFVDDRVKHVNNMEAVFAGSGIINVNFRYGFTDPVVKAFNPELADLEWNFFRQTGVLLTDAQAQALLNRRGH